MASTGSGSPVAYGLLEHLYVENKSVEDNLPIAVKALNSAMQRDCATGDGISLVTITKDGFREYSQDDVLKIAEKLKKK
jgi:proteasome beta subunit